MYINSGIVNGTPVYGPHPISLSKCEFAVMAPPVTVALARYSRPNIQPISDFCLSVCLLASTQSDDSHNNSQDN
jgi:hypothetical protein